MLRKREVFVCKGDVLGFLDRGEWDGISQQCHSSNVIVHIAFLSNAYLSCVCPWYGFSLSHLHVQWNPFFPVFFASASQRIVWRTMQHSVSHSTLLSLYLRHLSCGFQPSLHLSLLSFICWCTFSCFLSSFVLYVCAGETQGSCLIHPLIKGIIYLKMKNLSPFTHHHVVPNLFTSHPFLCNYLECMGTEVYKKT